MRFGHGAWRRPALNVAPALVYFTAFHWTPMRGSPGKWMLGLRVTDLDGNCISVPLARMQGRA